MNAVNQLRMHARITLQDGVSEPHTCNMPLSCSPDASSAKWLCEALIPQFIIHAGMQPTLNQVDLLAQSGHEGGARHQKHFRCSCERRETASSQQSLLYVCMLAGIAHDLQRTMALSHMRAM